MGPGGPFPFLGPLTATFIEKTKNDSMENKVPICTHLRPLRIGQPPTSMSNMALVAMEGEAESPKSSSVTCLRLPLVIGRPAIMYLQCRSFSSNRNFKTDQIPPHFFHYQHDDDVVSEGDVRLTVCICHNASKIDTQMST